MADSRKLDLIFKDSEKATKNIRIVNPRSDVDREMVLQKTGVCRGQYMFAQANSLALAVIDAPAALTGVANVKYKIPVTVGATLVARAEVVRKQEDKYTIWVKIRNNHREVFRAKFLIVAIPEQRSQEDENRS